MAGPGGDPGIAERGVRGEDAGDNEAQAERSDQQRAPRAATLAGDGPAHADGAEDGQDSGHEEARDLNPTLVPQAQHADGIAADVEALPGQHLGDRHHEEHHP